MLTLVLALAAGVLAQSAARHARIPGIVLLLAAGAVLGPDWLGWVSRGRAGWGSAWLGNLWRGRAGRGCDVRGGARRGLVWLGPVGRAAAR